MDEYVAATRPPGLTLRAAPLPPGRRLHHRAYHGNPVAVVLDGDGLRPRRCSASRTGRTCPRRRSCCRRRSPAPTTGCGSSRRRASCRSPGIRRSAPATRGSRTAARRAAATTSCRSAAAGLVRVRRTRGRAGLRRAAAAALRPGRRGRGRAHRRRCSDRRARRSSTPQWADNGPGWVAVLLADADAVLAVRPARSTSTSASSGLHPPGAAAAFEVRAFFPQDGTTAEDPVTGSLNASLAEWLLRTGRVDAPYVASQGAALGRAGPRARHPRRRRRDLGRRRHGHLREPARSTSRSAARHRPHDHERLARRRRPASGSGASGGSCDRSSSQAKNRTNGRRRCVVWSRIVPRSTG